MKTQTYTVKDSKIPFEYMGQLLECPEVVTEGKILEECREMIHDAFTCLIPL